MLQAVNRLLKVPIVCRAGSFIVPDGAGIGIEFEPSVLSRFATKIGR
jgi:hypothetical protein